MKNKKHYVRLAALHDDADMRVFLDGIGVYELKNALEAYLPKMTDRQTFCGGYLVRS